MKEIYLLKVGMTMTEGMVSEWYVADGAEVRAGELLYALETEKVNLDVEADATGVVRHRVDVGIMLEPGDVIGFIFREDESMPDDIMAIPVGRAEPEPDKPIATASPVSPGGRVRASPAARKLAESLGVELDRVQGTGPGGRIVKEDVESASKESSESAGQRIRHSAMRRTIAQRMFQSLASSAQLTMNMTATMDEAVTLRERLVEEWAAEGIRPSYTDLLVKAVASALPLHPLMNSTFSDDHITLVGDIHIGIAVSLEEGLVVPVLRHADRLALIEITRESQRLADAARAGTLGIDEYAGGTFTISSLGMYNVDSFTPIINDGQAAILGVNRLVESVAWKDDRPVRTNLLNLSLTWDHRIVDGVPVAKFLAEVCRLLAEPQRLLE